MSDACREWRDDIGGLAIGRPDPGRADALRAHLDGCASCRAEVDDLRPVAEALRSAGSGHLGGPLPEPPPHLGREVLARIDAARAGRRRRRVRRVVLVAAGAVAAAATAVVTLVPGGSSAEATTLAFGPHPSGVDATARLVEQSWGTQVEFRADGLDPDGWYWLWVTGPDGRRVGAGSFQGSATGEVRVVLGAALPYQSCDRVWVTDGADAVVLDAWLHDDG